MLVNLKFIRTEWVLFWFYSDWSLVLLGVLYVSGSGGWLPCYELWRVLLKQANFSQAFYFSRLLLIKYFSRLYSKFVCLWYVFPGREGLYRYSKFKTLANYPKGSFQVTCLTGGTRRKPSVGFSFPCKLNLINFSFNGFRMRTCNARPWIVYILSREDRLFLRKENPNISFSEGEEGFGWGSVDPLLLVNIFARPIFLP